MCNTFYSSKACALPSVFVMRICSHIARNESGVWCPFVSIATIHSCDWTWCKKRAGCDCVSQTGHSASPFWSLVMIQWFQTLANTNKRNTHLSIIVVEWFKVLIHLHRPTHQTHVECTCVHIMTHMCTHETSLCYVSSNRKYTTPLQSHLNLLDL